MKTRRLQPLSSALVCSVFATLFLAPFAARAADTATTIWAGPGSTATTTLWATGTNWSTGTAPDAFTIAQFSTTFSNQPAFSGATPVSGLWLTTGVGQDVSITSGSGQLTLTGTGTINGNANTAILLDDTANHNLSIPGSNPVVTLASSNTSFLVNNAGTLTIYKTNLNGNTLTLGGTNAAGNINFTSVIGTTNTAGSIIVNTAGTVTFSSGSGAPNIFTGGLTLTAGTLRAAGNQAGELGAGTLSLGGGELQLANDTGLSYGRNTTVTGNTQITSDTITPGSAGVTHTLGTLSIGAQTLMIAKGGNVSSGTAGVAFGATTLTDNATFSVGTNATLKLGALSQSGGARSLTKTGDGTLAFGSNTNTTTGGLIIKEGTIDASAGNASAGGASNTVTLGDSAGGSKNASFVSNASQIYANPFVVAANTTGTLSIGTLGTAAVNITYSGGVTGNNNITFSDTGTGNLNVTTAAINNAGTIYNVGTGSGTLNITAAIGSNVTGLTQNSSTSAFTSSGGIAVNTGGTTLTNTSGTKLLTVSGGTTGTGNLILKNNSSTDNGVTLSGTTINHTGTITNAGGGSGITLISAVIGTNVTGVVQNSPTSTLNLTGANTFTSGLTIKQGTVQLGAATSAGTGTITLGDSSTTAATLILTSATTYTNALALGTSGSLTLINNTNNNTTFSGAVTGSNDLTISNNNVGSGAISMAGLINNTGKLIFNGTAAGSNLITGGIGSNVTDIILNSSTGALSITGLGVNSGGTTLTNTGPKTITISGTLSGTGSITNSGTGTGLTTISSVIGSSIAGVTQNAANSGLVLSGANTYSGDTKVLAGTLTLNLATSAGTSRIYVGDTSGSANSGLFIAGNITVANNLTVQTANSGVTTLGTNGANPGTFSGNVTLTGGGNVILNAFNSALNFTPASGAAFTGSGSLIITSSGMATSTTGQTYGISGATVSLTGASSYDGTTKVLSGALQISTATGVNVNTWLGTSNSAVVIGDTSGVQSARFLINAAAAGAIFSRDIFIQGGNGGISAVGATSNAAGTFSGNISLEKTVYLLGPNNGTGSTTFSGVISKGASAIGAVSVNVSGDRLSDVTLTNANSYDGGTVVGGGMLIGSVAGSLGSGNAVVDTGSLRLNSSTALATGKTVFVGPRGQLNVTAASGIDQAGLVALLAPGSTGSIGVSGTYSFALDLSALGDGNMYLGNDGSNGVYAAATLGASGGIYRVGWSNGGSGTLTLSTGVLVGANQLVVGGTQGYSHPTGNNGQGNHTEGNVILSVANSYTGGTIVNSDSVLYGQALTSGTPFGSTTAAMTLHNSTLRMLNSGTTPTNTTIGAVAFDGGATIMMNGATGGSNTLTAASLARIDRGTLILTNAASNSVLGTTTFVKAGGAIATAGTVKNSASTSVTMLAPYYVDSLGNYLSYDVTNGFTPITTSLTTMALGIANGVTSYVRMTATESIASSVEIAALSFANNSAALSLTNSTATPVTLKIDTGGITTLGSVLQSSTIGGNAANAVNLDFNGKEAILVLGGGTQNGGLVIQNAITNTGGNGLTKSGPGRLFLNSSASTFTGLITVNQSAIYINNDLALGSGAGLDNDIFLNGGGITTSGGVTLNAARTITLGTAGGSLISGSTNPFVVAGLITGTGGVLTLGTNNAATSTARSTIYLSNTANDFIAPIYVGTAGSNHHDLLFDDDHQLGDASNIVILSGGNAGLQYIGGSSASTARTINFQNQGGAIDVLTAGVTLTASGPITGSGMFNKNGLGTLALTGSAAGYSGTVNVNAGVLNVSNADALGATTAAISGSSGVSGGGVYVQSGAALEVQSTSGIALGNTGGKTMYLNGDGINNGTSNGGALRNVSGANSNAGAIILQSNTTIGADADSLTLSGVVSDAGTGSSLTKVGAGTLILSGANTFTGATAITDGKLVVNGSLAPGSAVSIGASATLGGSGIIGGTVFVAGTLSPGNSPGLLTTGAQTWVNGGNYNWQVVDATGIAGTGFDSIAITTGGLDLSALTTGGFNINLWSLSSTGPDVDGDALNFDTSTNHSWTLVSDTGDLTSIAGSLFNVNIAASNGTNGFSNDLGGGSFSIVGTGNSLDLVFTSATPVPEPATFAVLAALAAFGLAAYQRRRA